MTAERLLLGESPALFLVEVVVRMTVLYALLLFMMRLMGRRMAAQLSLSELAVILTLGAALGMPVQVVEAGLLPVVVILTVAVLFQRGLSRLGVDSPWLERATLGGVHVLLRDGVIDSKRLRAVQLSPAQLRMALRTAGVEQLGELRRVYLESAGSFSLVRFARARPGLSIVLGEPMGSRHEVDPERECCAACGLVAAVDSEQPPPRRCEGCGGETLVAAARPRTEGQTADGG